MTQNADGRTDGFSALYSRLNEIKHFGSPTFAGSVLVMCDMDYFIYCLSQLLHSLIYYDTLDMYT